MPLRVPVRVPILAVLSAAAFLVACGGGEPDAGASGQASSAGVRRIGLKRVDPGAAAPTSELAGHLSPKDGMLGWEVTAPRWVFEEGSSARPLRLTGVGDKRLVIPGPFDLQAFDRILVMVANMAHGSIRATLTTDEGLEISATADVLKGRVRHPAILKLPPA